MKFELSEDQKSIVSYSGRGLKVKAGAGAGKTFVLKYRVLSRPSKRVLYLAYNRPIKEEAESEFPGNCVCMTFHGLAYSLVGRRLKHKLEDSLKVSDIIQYVPNREQAKIVLATIEAFIISESTHIHAEHIPSNCGVVLSRNEIDWIAVISNKIWDKIIDPETNLKITHDVYFKLLALNPSLVDGYDEVMVDEAQDANGAKIQLISALHKRMTVVLVGDNEQAINGWSGAINAFDNPAFDNFDSMSLMKSYRFGDSVARLSNMILRYKADPNVLKVVGDSKATHIFKTLPQELDKEHVAIISRTVVGCIEQGITASLNGEKVYWVGGINGYGISDLIDVGYLKSNKFELIRNKDLQEFSSYKEFCHKSEVEDIKGYLKLIKLADVFNGYKDLYGMLKASCVENESDADVSIATAHKSKGMDWDTVILNDDFPSIINPRDKSDLEGYRAELNLWYVTVTRAKKHLIYGESALAELFHELGGFVIRHEMAVQGEFGQKSA